MRQVLLLLPLLLCIACSPSVTVPVHNKVSLSLDGLTPDWAISEGRYIVSGIGQGDKASIAFKIYNDSNSPKRISVNSKVPNGLTDGYTVLPLGWVVINDNIVVVPANSVQDVLIYLSIPDKVEVVDKLMEVWIGFIDTDQKGTARAEFCSRILVQMK